jgi:hypothetical protein
MRKLLVITFLLALAFHVSGQSIFKPVPQMFQNTADKTILSPDHKLLWRIDATIVLYEIGKNPETGFMEGRTFSGVGPAIGIQNYIPTSAIDPTPYNNWGASLGVLVGPDLYNPDVAKMKVALIGNLFQYFRFGVDYTFNAKYKIGYIIGGGITF